MRPAAPKSCQVLRSFREMYFRIHLGFESHKSGALKTAASSLQAGMCKKKQPLHQKPLLRSGKPFPPTPGADGQALLQETPAIFSHNLSSS